MLVIGQITRILQSVEVTLGILGGLAALLLFLQFLWPSWQILQRTIYHARSFRRLRALGATLHLIFYLTETKSLYKAARLRIEVELLHPRPVRDDFDSNLAYRQHVKAWRQEKDKVLSALVHQTRLNHPIIDVNTCFDLYQSEDRIRRYFNALRKTKRSKAVFDQDTFISNVRIGTGFIAPLHLVTGLLAHFHDRWEPVIKDYGSAVSRRNDPLGRRLRMIQTFLFDCWLLWGLSIPLCHCKYWWGDLAMQYGYGDENNSLPIYGNGLFGTFEQDVLRQIAPVAEGPRPIAYQVSVVGRPRWGPSIDERNLNFGPAQQAIHDDRTGGIILQSESIDVIGPGAHATYYSAYIWVLFVAYDGRGEPVHDQEECWRGFFPFFVHGNIAEHDTYLFQKRQLAHEVLAKIDRFVCEVLPEGSHVTFQYACAIDDSGCGSEIRFSDASPKLHQIMQELLTTAEFKRLGDSGRIILEHDLNMEGFASSCQLPKIVTEYYDSIKSSGASDAATT